MPRRPSRPRDVASWNARSIPQRVMDRAFSRWDADRAGCWISRYSVGSHGYAQIGWSESGKVRMVLAHRASWEHENGPVPIGLTIDHLCKQRQCVNPQHMRLLENFENARRTNGSDWPLGGCRQGHGPEHLERTLRRRKDGSPRNGLRCRLCMQESRARYEAAHPDRVLAAKRAYEVRRKRAA